VKVNGTAVIASINGELIRPLGLMGAHSKGIRLNPGTYELTLGCRHTENLQRTFAELNGTCTLEAGHTYIPTGHFLPNNKIFITLLDVGTENPEECLVVNTPHITKPDYCHNK
jgi:hypothetical protein